MILIIIILIIVVKATLVIVLCVDFSTFIDNWCFIFKMNVILEYSDHYFLDSIYPKQWTSNDFYRQMISIFVIEIIGFWFLYIISGTLSYHYLFDKNLMKSKLFLPDQISREIKLSIRSIPFIAIMTLPIFIGEVRGYSRLYRITDGDRISLVDITLQLIGFIIFTDTAIYWIHRWLHHPLIYHPVHKPHHQWIVPTPFASHAFHPLDGFLQSVPYHIYVYVLPMEENLYFVLFVLVSVWSTSIHDGNHKLSGTVINSAACHTLHHRQFNYNYGQYFTLWDRIGKTYRNPHQYCVQ